MQMTIFWLEEARRAVTSRRDPENETKWKNVLNILGKKSHLPSIQ